MAYVLIIRLSAIGDVAMTIPIIYSAAKANPQHSFTVLTQAFLIPVFINRPPNVEIIGINTFGSEKTLRGITRFARGFSKYDYDIVLDLHNVIRSIIIRSFFILKGKKIYVIDKARKERKRLTARKNKVLKQIRPVTERYADVFRKAGLAYTETFHSLFDDHAADFRPVEYVTGEKSGKWIGIAPFAKHEGKIYPLYEMEEIVATLSKWEDTTIFLFGAKGKEERILSGWVTEYSNVRSVIGCMSLDSELTLISQLDVLVSMDSANMHFASLVGTPVVSVWGATHPYAGFYGYHQKPENAVQIQLDCRPCSIYGDKPCFRGDWACMTELPPEKIILKINEVLSK